MRLLPISIPGRPVLMPVYATSHKQFVVGILVTYCVKVSYESFERFCMVTLCLKAMCYSVVVTALPACK